MKALEKPDRTPGLLRLVDKPEPVPSAGDVLLRVAGAGICGTDIHILDDDFPYQPPVTLGHEFSGTVIRVGPGVSPEWIGARVASEVFHVTCGTCPACRTGRLNMCLEKLPLGTKLDGGFAPFVVTRVRNLHVVPDTIPLEVGALAEPLACVCNSLCDPSAVGPGDSVLVVGPGTIGVLAAQVARAAGGRVLLVGTERDADRLETARSVGIASALVTDASTIEAHCGLYGPDVVVECSGSETGIQFALEHAGRMGRYVQVGHAGRRVTVPFDLISYRELRVRAGQGAPPRAWDRAFALLSASQVSLEPLVTEIASLQEWERVFADVRAGVGLKHIFDPHRSA
jgi:L-iditol 2-dehydrogenase